jgi:hypothetical protein
VRVLLSTYESRGDVEPLAHGSRFRSAADEPRRAAELEAVHFDAVAAPAQGRDALVVTGVLPVGVVL